MKATVFCLALAVLTAMSFTACKNSSTGSSRAVAVGSSSILSSSKSAGTEEPGKFDIEVVRKKIIVQGQHFEVPTVLKNLPAGWSYKIDKELSHVRDKGLGIADIYYKGKAMFSAGIENYYPGREGESIIYNMSVGDRSRPSEGSGEGSIDNLIPDKTTKQEVIAKYGKPNKTEKKDLEDYYYGTVNGWKTPGGRTNDHNLVICFNKDGTIEEIVVTYADLSRDD